MFGVIGEVTGHEGVGLPAFGGVPLQAILQIGEMIPQHFVHLRFPQGGDFDEFPQV